MVNMFNSQILSTVVLVMVSSVLAQLPYNPTRLILSSDQSKVYQFTAQPLQPIFSYFDLSKQISSSTTPIVLNYNLNFLSSNQALLPVADNKGISILFGNCQDASSNAQIWRYTPDQGGNNGTWTNLHLGSSQTTIETNYLSAGFSFSPDGSINDTSLYVFGGMCPDGNSNAINWTSQASYSNTMYSVSADTQSTYHLAVTGTRAPPIAEAGLSITPLSLASSKSSSGKVSQQQNFVLLGGHTEMAFINMSQIALFSLPEASWTFLDVNQSSGSTGELIRSDSPSVEPRSGHTAILSEDGSKIIVFGGWVGNITNPASPQLAVLQLGQGYGGSAWQWSFPTQSNPPLSSNQGVYGHGAVMLPGGIMFISGGTIIGSTKQKRSTQSPMFYNVNTGAWSTTYKSSSSSTNGLDTSQKVGIGAGLGLGLTALIAIFIVWLMYRRRIREKKAERERHLRELALGSERYISDSRIVSRSGSRLDTYDVRSTSWGSRQEQQVDNGFILPWTGRQTQDDWQKEKDGPNGVERSGTEVPSPTRGLRKSLSTRGPPTYGVYPAPIRGPGSVFRIDEAEEDNSIKSPHVESAAGSRLSDPFKDPPDFDINTPAEERKKEVQGWVEDWQSAAVSMNLSRNPSQSRTYSNLSQAHSSSGESASYKSGRESPTKSDRTGSNLSERSVYTLPKSGNVSRQMSQRSQSGGHALFTNAAAAMARLGGINREITLERTTSKRSISLNTAMRPRSRDAQSLLEDYSPIKSLGEVSPIKDYKNYTRTDSLTSQRRKVSLLGSMKRVLTGTGNVDVQAQVEQYEERFEPVSPIKTEPEMSDINDPSATFWQGKRGAKDWNEESSQTPHPPSSMANSKRRSTSNSASMIGEYDGEDWDVETAVQQRVVQVMFTVPKEKLRVVNADALSLVSQSDIDEREDHRGGDLSRMHSFRDDSGMNEKGKRRDLR